MMQVVPARAACAAPSRAATRASCALIESAYGHMNSLSHGHSASPSPKPRASDWNRWLWQSTNPGMIARPAQSTLRAALQPASSSAGPDGDDPVAVDGHGTGLDDPPLVVDRDDRATGEQQVAAGLDRDHPLCAGAHYMQRRWRRTCTLHVMSLGGFTGGGGHGASRRSSSPGDPHAAPDELGRSARAEGRASRGAGDQRWHRRDGRDQLRPSPARRAARPLPRPGARRSGSSSKTTTATVRSCASARA